MKKIYLLCAVALLAAAGCNKEVPQGNLPTGSVVLTASVETDDTKVGATINEDTKKVAFTWTKGDAIAVQTQSGFETFALSGDGGQASGEFVGSANPVDGAVAVFPAAAAGVVNGNTLTVNLPATYTYVAGQTNALLCAKAAGNNLSFAHLGGLVALELKGVPAGAKLVFSAKDKQLSGAYTVDLAAETPQLSVAATTAADNTLTVSFPEAVAEAVAYLPLPVGEYPSWTAKVLGADDAVICEVSTTETKTVSRKTLKVMPYLIVDLKDWFVTPAGAGDKSGSSWDNAMGMEQFRPMISSDYGAKSEAQCKALDGATFHFMEGSYCATTSAKDRLKMQFPNYKKACHITFLGGYDQSSTGTDLTKRDIVANVTEFTGDLNNNGKADSGDTGIFCIDAWCDLSIDGCTFAHSYGKDRWKQKALMLNTDTSGALARVNVSNCIFHDLYDFNDSDAKYEGGAAIWTFNRSVATVHNCKFYDCHSTSRGGAIRAGAASSIIFLNNTSVFDNAIGDTWGNGVQISNGNFCVNNSIITRNTGKGAALNGGGNWMIVNSTIVNAYVSGNASSDMAIRNESNASSNAAVLMNSIVLFDGDKASIYINGDTKLLTSKGHNLYGTVAGTVAGFVTDPTDKAEQTLAGLGLTWNEAGYYTWAGNVDGFTKAKLSDIENVIKNDCNKTIETFTNVGLEFYNWLQTLEPGKNPLAYDQNGNARDVNAMWPGAYEKR